MEEQWLTKRWQEPDVAGMHILIVSDKPHIWVDLFFLFFLHLFFFIPNKKKTVFLLRYLYSTGCHAHKKISAKGSMQAVRVTRPADGDKAGPRAEKRRPV